MEGAAAGLGALSVLLPLIGLFVLFVLAFLMPYFVYKTAHNTKMILAELKSMNRRMESLVLKTEEKPASRQWTA